MASPQQKGYLTYRGISLVLKPSDPNLWSFCDVVKDSLWAAVAEQGLGTVFSHEGDEEAHQTAFGDNNVGNGVLLTLGRC